MDGFVLALFLLAALLWRCIRRAVWILLLCSGPALIAAQGWPAIRPHIDVPHMGVTQAFGDPVCKPTLGFKDAKLSPMQPPTLDRRWTAIVTVDASRCATTSGRFEVGFSRMKENSMEVEFREQFIWSAPTVQIGVGFAPDEAVEAYWIDNIQACPCAR